MGRRDFLRPERIRPVAPDALQPGRRCRARPRPGGRLPALRGGAGGAPVRTGRGDPLGPAPARRRAVHGRPGSPPGARRRDDPARHSRKDAGAARAVPRLRHPDGGAANRRTAAHPRLVVPGAPRVLVRRPPGRELGPPADCRVAAAVRLRSSGSAWRRRVLGAPLLHRPSALLLFALPRPAGAGPRGRGPPRPLRPLAVRGRPERNLPGAGEIQPGGGLDLRVGGRARAISGQDVAPGRGRRRVARRDRLRALFSRRRSRRAADPARDAGRSRRRVPSRPRRARAVVRADRVLAGRRPAAPVAARKRAPRGLTLGRSLRGLDRPPGAPGARLGPGSALPEGGRSAPPHRARRRADRPARPAHGDGRRGALPDAVGAGGGHPRRYVCGARRLRGPVRVRESGAPDLPGGAGLLVRAARLPGSVSVRRHSPGPPLRAQRLVGGARLVPEHRRPRRRQAGG